MSIFFKRKASAASACWVLLDEWQKKYAHRLADWLGRKTARVPRRRLRVWVILIVLVLAGLNVMVTLLSLREEQPVRPGAFQPVVLARPSGLAPPSEPARTLRAYLDSLRRDSVGSWLLDSLLRVRPGLADTLKELEKMER